MRDEEAGGGVRRSWWRKREQARGGGARRWWRERVTEGQGEMREEE